MSDTNFSYPPSVVPHFLDFTSGIQGDEKKLKTFMANMENLETILSETAPGERELAMEGFANLFKVAIPLFFKVRKITESAKLLEIIKKVFPTDCDVVKFMIEHVTIAVTLRKLLDEGKKKEAKKKVLKFKEDGDRLISQNLIEKSEALCYLYCAYFQYFHHPSVRDSKKALLNGFKYLDYSWSTQTATLMTWVNCFNLLIVLCCDENAFRQSHYLIRAAKVFMDDFKEKNKTTVTKDELNKYEPMIILSEAIHIVNLLMTLKEHELAQTEESKKKFELNTELLTFNGIQIPGGEAVMDGNVKDFVELQKIFFKAKIMKNVALEKNKDLEFLYIQGKPGYYLLSIDAKIEYLEKFYSARK